MALPVYLSITPLNFLCSLCLSDGNSLFTALSTNLLPMVVAAVFPTSNAAGAACQASALHAVLESNRLKKLLIDSNIPDPPYACFLLYP